ncbi:hypothetical protein GCM10008937_07730 [Deinococcus depolymerans]|uniref:Uncharacterized protein n=1 Tax=Deinococcus depolymerans TaxID=392408 RepID=A0ABP3LL24_9DEIO
MRGTPLTLRVTGSWGVLGVIWMVLREMVGKGGRVASVACAPQHARAAWAAMTEFREIRFMVGQRLAAWTVPVSFAGPGGVQGSWLELDFVGEFNRPPAKVPRYPA